MPESFGGRLRQQRERQEIALATIADQTKIKMSLLEGLERDDVSHWPTGIFRRAFVRAYAHAISLEPDVVVREFLELYPDPAEVVAVDPSLRPDVDQVHDGAKPPTRFRYLVSSAIGSLSGRRSAAAQDRRGPAPCPSIIERPVIAEPSRRTERSPIEDDDTSLVKYPLVARRLPSTDNASIANGENPPAANLSRAAEGSVTDEAPPTVERASTVESVQMADCAPTVESISSEPDFEAVAQVCTDLGRAVYADEVAPLLERAAGALGAVGLIVWAWDPQTSALRAAVAHGYSDRVLAQLPAVKCDAANATAAAFRTAQLCTVAGDEQASGALVAPLITPDGCVGVLAIEWPVGREQSGSGRAVACIFAALLARWITAAQPADVADRRLA